jgi:hypothetical protein|tara:strand:+ start:397 stop:843 length:447 start_codon:yes stop_codon:yes gene_type:complete
MKYLNLTLLSLFLFLSNLPGQDLISQEIDRLEEVFIEEAVKTNTKMLAISAGSIIIGLHMLSDLSFSLCQGSLCNDGTFEKLIGGLGFIAAGVLLPPLAAIKKRDVSSAEIAVRNEAREFAKNNAGFGIKREARKVARPIVTGILTRF